MTSRRPNCAFAAGDDCEGLFAARPYLPRDRPRGGPDAEPQHDRNRARVGMETSPTPARYLISLSVHDNMPGNHFARGAVCHTERKLNGMLCRYYIPAAPLSDFIEDFWLYND